MGGRSGHGVQRAVHGIGYCGKCASDVWTLTLIGTSPFFFKGCAKVFFAWAILAAEQRGKPEGTTEGNEGNKDGQAEGNVHRGAQDAAPTGNA